MLDGGSERLIGWIVTFDTDSAGRYWALRLGRTRIGKGPNNHVSLPSDPLVSEPHAFIMARGNTCTLMDEASSHGTRVNGEELGMSADRTRELSSGDRIQIGRSLFQVVLLDPGDIRRNWPSVAAADEDGR